MKLSNFLFIYFFCYDKLTSVTKKLQHFSGLTRKRLLLIQIGVQGPMGLVEKMGSVPLR